MKAATIVPLITHFLRVAAGWLAWRNFRQSDKSPSYRFAHAVLGFCLASHCEATSSSGGRSTVCLAILPEMGGLGQTQKPMFCFCLLL